MKTLIILSAFLLVLSSCTKEIPVPDPAPDPDPASYIPDPNPAPDPPSDPDNDDDDPSSSCYNDHPAGTITWTTATGFNPVG